MKISAIGGSDFHQPERLMPEGPLVLARPTTVFWLPELSEDAVLAAMKSGCGYVTESPSGPHLEIRAGDVFMGGTAAGLASFDVVVRGAAGDQLVLIDATGEVAALDIVGDDFSTTMAMENAQKFIRAEIVAAASRERLLAEYASLLEGRELPWQLKNVDVAGQPIRRALSNPIYIGS